MNKQFCGFDLGNSKVHWELSEKNALNSFFFKSKQGNELLYPVMSHIICFNSFSGTQCQICFSSNNYKKKCLFFHCKSTTLRHMGCDAFHITGRGNICSEILWFIVFKQRFPPEFSSICACRQ